MRQKDVQQDHVGQPLAYGNLRLFGVQDGADIIAITAKAPLVHFQDVRIVIDGQNGMVFRVFAHASISAPLGVFRGLDDDIRRARGAIETAQGAAWNASASQFGGNVHREDVWKPF